MAVVCGALCYTWHEQIKEKRIILMNNIPGWKDTKKKGSIFFLRNLFQKTYKVRSVLFNYAYFIDLIVTLLILSLLFTQTYVIVGAGSAMPTPAIFIAVYILIAAFFLTGQLYGRKKHQLPRNIFLIQGFNLFETLFRYFLLMNNDQIVVIGKNGGRKYFARYLFMREKNIKRYTAQMHKKDLGYNRFLNDSSNVDLGAGLYSSVPLRAIVAMGY